MVMMAFDMMGALGLMDKKHRFDRHLEGSFVLPPPPAPSRKQKRHYNTTTT
jgi:hypothetical protein